MTSNQIKHYLVLLDLAVVLLLLIFLGWVAYAGFLVIEKNLGRDPNASIAPVYSCQTDYECMIMDEYYYGSTSEESVYRT